jgi:hypothetical protein
VGTRRSQLWSYYVIKQPPITKFKIRLNYKLLPHQLYQLQLNRRVIRRSSRDCQQHSKCCAERRSDCHKILRGLRHAFFNSFINSICYQIYSFPRVRRIFLQNNGLTSTIIYSGYTPNLTKPSCVAITK